MISIATREEVSSRTLQVGLPSSSTAATTLPWQYNNRSFEPLLEVLRQVLETDLGVAQNPASRPSLLEVLRQVLETDWSSVQPRFEIGNETYWLAQEGLEQEGIEGIIENDLVVQMQPRRRYSLPAEVVSRERAKPTLPDIDWTEF